MLGHELIRQGQQVTCDLFIRLLIIADYVAWILLIFTQAAFELLAQAFLLLILLISLGVYKLTELVLPRVAVDYLADRLKDVYEVGTIVNYGLMMLQVTLERYFLNRFRELYYATCVFWLNGVYSIIHYLISSSILLLVTLSAYKQEPPSVSALINIATSYVIALAILYSIFFFVWFSSIAMDALGKVTPKYQPGLSFSLRTLRNIFKLNLLEQDDSGVDRNTLPAATVSSRLRINLDRVLKANLYLACPSSLAGAIFGIFIAGFYLRSHTIAVML